MNRESAIVVLLGLIKAASTTVDYDISLEAATIDQGLEALNQLGVSYPEIKVGVTELHKEIRKVAMELATTQAETEEETG